MANKILIKRSTTTAAPAGLANGELAYTSNGEILFLGHPDGTTGSIAIGGRRAPGTLTANQALVANSTSGINQVIAGQVNAITTSAVGSNVIANTTAYFVGNSTVNTFITQNLLDLGGQINANGGVGTAGQILTSGAAGNVYWSSPASGVAGSNSQVQFNANGVLAGDDGFTFDGVSNTLTVANAIVTANITHPVGTTELYVFGTSNASSGAVEAGGDLFFKAGSANGGGLVTIRGGSVADAGAVTRTGGYVWIAGGNAVSGDIGGDVYVDGGEGGAGTSAATSGGKIYITGGPGGGNSAAVGGDIEIIGGNGNTTGGTGGSVIIAGGFGAGSSRANVQITKLKTLDVMTVGGNIVLGTTTISANGGVGTAGQVLTSGAAGNVYWTTPSSGVTNLTDTANATTVTILSDTGTDAVLDSANATTAGILTSADWTKLNNMPANSVAGSTTQVMFNNAGVLAGDVGFTFVTATDALTLGGAAQTTSPVFSVANTTTSANLSSATLTIGTSVVNSTAHAAGSNVYINTTTLFAGNSTINASHTSSLVQVSNSTSTANLTAAGLAIGTTTANTTGLFVGANASINTSAHFVGNSTVNSFMTATVLDLGGQINANGGVGTAGQVLISGGAANASWASSLSLTDLTLSGNLDINGTLTTVDTTNLSVTDSIISLARGQTTANTLDIGFYGTYGNATVVSYSGLIRDASDGVYKLFAGAIPEPTTTVDTANVNFALANLSVNSITLTSALAAIYGGTGTGTYTSGDLLVANTGNTLSKLSLGTDGKVLQSNGTAVVYADLDGGTF